MRLRGFLIAGAFSALVWGTAYACLAATPAELRRAEQINQRINHEGRDVCWQYAFAKVDLLNMPQRARVEVVIAENGELHSVVVLDGEWVLDNRFPWMQRKESLIRFGYVWSN